MFNHSNAEIAEGDAEIAEMIKSCPRDCETESEWATISVMKIEPGEIVLAVLHTPREKLLGVVDEINAAGIFMRGIDLSYFEDWSRAIAAGEPHLHMSDYFLPMWRIERITRDAANGEIPSMSEQFERNTGRPLTEL